MRDPLIVYRPAAHSSQLNEPFFNASWSSGHGIQSSALSCLVASSFKLSPLNVLRLHSLQSACAASSWYSPALHTEHNAAAGLCEYLPAAQDKHSADPGFVTKRPGLHGVHVAFDDAPR
jgi:hypothetical protein